MWSYLYETLIVGPLRTLYFQGPSRYNIGFWQGQRNSTICHALTDQPEYIWEQQPMQCQHIIHKHFQGYMTMVETVGHFYALYRIYYMCQFYSPHVAYLMYYYVLPMSSKFFYILYTKLLYYDESRR